MNGKNRDYEELIRFQKQILTFGESVEEIGKDLEKAADEASRFLADDVSAAVIRKVRDGAAYLDCLGKHVCIEIQPQIEKTMKEIDSFDKM